MSRPVLQLGSSGTQVKGLQKLLNQWLVVEYGNDAKTLVPDGEFGNNTLTVVRDFQLTCHLVKDGVVGARTWAALEQSEEYNSFDFPSPFVAAPNQYQCWAGATAMLLRRNTAATERPDGVNFEDLPNNQTGGLENSMENMKRFATAHNMQIESGSNYGCKKLIELLKTHGRLMLNMKGVNSLMTKGSDSDSHFVILVGARGTGLDSTTTISVWNPSGSGGKFATVCSYQYFKSRYPNMLYQILHTTGNRSVPIYGKET